MNPTQTPTVNKRRVFLILSLIIIVIALPLTVFLSRQLQQDRSRAAAPDQLEAEGGVLGGNAKIQTDSLASGGQYVLLATQSKTPTPTPRVLGSEVWFGPDFASADFINLFTQPDKWPVARSKVRVFAWFNMQLDSTCAICGPNTLAALTAADAFKKLKDWGIIQAAPGAPVKPTVHFCTANNSAPLTIGKIKYIEDHGGDVGYVAMDEPLYGGQATVNGITCGFSPSQSAIQTADFIKRVNAVYPDVKIGDAEPYPYFSFDQLKAWIEEIERQGVKLAFFQLDVNPSDRAYSEQAFKEGAVDFKLFLKNKGIPFGVIINHIGANNRTDQEYFEGAMNWAKVVKSAVGVTEQTIFQSWFPRTGTGARDIPINLPENDQIVFSHTRLINDGWNLLSSP